jgi:hypothetical protein
MADADSAGRSALHRAASAGDYPIVVELLARGDPVMVMHDVDKAGDTPLHAAARVGAVDVVSVSSDALALTEQCMPHLTLLHARTANFKYLGGPSYERPKVYCMTPPRSPPLDASTDRTDAWAGTA